MTGGLWLFLVASLLVVARKTECTVKIFNATEYRQALGLIPKSASCVRSISQRPPPCVPCYLRKTYLIRCQSNYGRSSRLVRTDCNTRYRRPYCRFKCEFKALPCCYKNYGHLCLLCPKGSLHNRSSHKSVCSGRGSCRSGIKGTGTCACRYQYRGTACQKCRKGYYGLYCRQRCRCVHGYCDGGLRRNCICKSGWTGPTCSKKILNCPQSCGTNRKCAHDGSCICKIGYVGVNCTAPDLCAAGKNPCGKYASCTANYSSTELRIRAFCKCKPGFFGDGFQCILSNPCHSGFRCKSPKEQCLVVSREMPRCVCINKYHRVNGTCVKRTCKQPELCSKNSVCIYDASYANSQYCQCKSGYFGKPCLPTILKVARGIGVMHRRSSRLLTDIATALQRTSYIKKITVLLPLTTSRPSNSAVVRSTIMSRHTVLSAIYNRNGTYWSAYGEKIVFQFKPGNKTANVGSISVNNITIQIKYAYRFIGGMIYVLEKPIWNPNDQYAPKKGNTELQYLERISNSMSSLYKQFFLKKSYRRMSKRVVIFPIEKLSKHEHEYLTSSDAVAQYKLKHFVEVMTMYTSSNFSPVTLYMRGLTVMGMRSWRLKVMSDGRSFLGGSRVIVNGVVIGNTVIIIVDKALESSLPRPILPGTCNLKQTHSIKIMWPRTCPPGTYKMNRKRWSKTVVCLKDVYVKMQCCKGFYGPNCAFHCPGPYGKPCHGNGQCSEGIKGNGKCVCQPGFEGLECEKCSSWEMYGPGCNLTCGCVHGVCEVGTIFATGRCLRCHRGYTGPNCNKQVVYCNATCALNEHCEQTQFGQKACKCNFGFRKSNNECVAINPCQDTDSGFGRCHSEAVCKYLGPGNSSCVCRKGWYGDGVACEREWAQCKKSADCKVDGSVCIRGACRCLNGRTLSKKNECMKKFQCHVKNGDCHPYAICLPGARDYNSHCMCRQNVSGDGFICLVSWSHSPEMQEMGALSFSRFYISLMDAALKNRQKKLGANKPITIIYSKTHDKVPTMGTTRNAIIDGLNFVPQKGALYQTTDFFYPNAETNLFKIQKRGNDTFIGGSKVLHANIYVKEGLLHIIDEKMLSTPKAAPIAVNKTRTAAPRPVTTPTPRRPTTDAPPLADGQLGYLVFDKDECPEKRRRQFPAKSFVTSMPNFGAGRPSRFSFRKPVYVCLPKSPDLWPQGSYCAIEVTKAKRASCPVIQGNRNLRPVEIKYTSIYRRWGTLGKSIMFQLCCGTFSKTPNIPVMKKTMQSFSLINARYCPKFDSGWSLAEDRIMFRPYTVRITKGSLLVRRCPRWLCFYLCHYTERTVSAFGVPKSYSGCEKDFKTGYRVQHLEQNDTKMPMGTLHLSGFFKTNHNTIRLEFCVSIGKHFPLSKGSYCVYRKLGKCPRGFTSSWAHIDDEDDTNGNNFGGVVPDGVYNTDTRYYFCCRNDTSPLTLISLPFTKPFYLFKHPSRKTCQKVIGFREKLEILTLDAEDKRKLGKPAVVVNGTVPMSRSQLRGSDVDVHYCFYNNNPLRYKTWDVTWFYFGSFCPPPSRANIKRIVNGTYTGKNYPTCTWRERGMKSSLKNPSWPDGDYCFLKSLAVECFDDFYKVRVNTDLTVNITYNYRAGLNLCCRYNREHSKKPLKMPFSSEYDFGLLATDCPQVHMKILHKKTAFARTRKQQMYYLCSYSSSWPTTLGFALPKLSKTCPPGFRQSTILKEYLGNSQMRDVFEVKGSQSEIVLLEICVKEKGDGKKPWPAGNYCILSSDENVVNEFPIVVAMTRDISDQDRRRASFFFCRSDAKSKRSWGLPFSQSLAVPSVFGCPRISSMKQLNMTWRHATFKSEMLQLQRSQLVDYRKAEGALSVCIYSTSATRYAQTVSFFRSNTTEKCNCVSHSAVCKNGICRCRPDHFGDGNICQQCSCGAASQCRQSLNYFARDCSCVLGATGTRFSCNADPYFQPVARPDPDITHWPRGQFSFLLTYDRVDCPKGFQRESSFLIGRGESINYEMSVTSTLCSKTDSRGQTGWPDGNYCVWATPQGLCPADLKLEEMFLPFKYVKAMNVEVMDKFIKKSNYTGQVLFTVNFCCKSSVSNSELIFPPADMLTLLRRDEKCPSVRRMSLEREMVYLARGIDDVVLSLPTQIPKKNWTGPAYHWERENKRLSIYLCNYILQRHEDYPSSCNESKNALCRPKQTLYSIINEDATLAPLKGFLKRCHVLDTIKNLHHMMLSIFLDASMLQKNASLADIECEFLKNNVILSKDPLTRVMPRLTPAGLHFSSALGSGLAIVRKDNESQAFYLGNSAFDATPIVFANNGMIFLLKKFNIARFRQPPKSKTALIVGCIFTILIIAAALGVAYWYFRKRHVSLSVSSFTNPVYYRRVEDAQQ